MAKAGLGRRWACLAVLAISACADDAPGATADASGSGPGTGADRDTGDDGGPAATGPGPTRGGGSTTAGDTSTTADTNADATTEPATGDGSTGAGAGPTIEPVDPILAFTEVGASIGFDYVHGTVHTSPNCLVDTVFSPGAFCIAERMTGGFAVGDYDGDGDDDVYVPRTYGGDLLLANAGDGTFADVAASAGIEREPSSSAVWADFDNDGDQDLYVTAIGDTRHYLYVNDGAGHFTEEAIARGAGTKSPHAHVPYAIGLGDYDLDGWLDLYVSEWMSDTGIGKHPSHNRLLHNLGAAAPGHFEDVTEAAGVNIDAVWSEVAAQAGSWGFSPAFADLDGDRWPDLVVVSDFRCSRVFFNDGDGTFTDGTVASGAGLDANGMGSTFGDYDGDGDLDWYVTAITNPGEPPENRLYRNEGDRTFTELAGALGVGTGGWGWGATFFDPDNDGDLDLLAASGYYYTAFVADPNLFWRNEGDGTFSPEMALDVGLDVTAQSRGVVAFDFDDDGDDDVLVANNAEAPSVLRNDSVTSHDWLRVHVQGTTSNRDGIGARVRVRATAGGPWQTREIGSASHYIGQQSKTAHFGVGFGAAPIDEVRVYWPATDTEQVFEDVARNSVLEVLEP